MFKELTSDLLDLTADVKGETTSLFAMVVEGCCSCCCCLGSGSRDD
jgi:hypothetical protein